MNILYIGPYRLNNSFGYESLNLLLNLQDEYKNVVARPIYCEQSINKSQDTELILDQLENNNTKNFDVIVQHTTPESMAYTSKVSRNIFIPILQNRPNNYHQKQILHFLQTKGPFVISNNIDQYILENSQISNKYFIKTHINNRLCNKPNGTFKFGLYSTYKKYYTITNSSHVRNIKNLIINFIKNNNEDNTCLILFMQGVTQPILDTYNNFIKQAYQKLGIKFSISKIIIIPIELNNYTLSTIHSCCDIYVDINNDIYKYYAFHYNKPIVCNTSELTVFDDYSNLDDLEFVSYKEPIDLHTIQSIASPVLTLNDIIKNNV